MQLIPDTAERFGVRDALDPAERAAARFTSLAAEPVQGRRGAGGGGLQRREGNVMRYRACRRLPRPGVRAPHLDFYAPRHANWRGLPARGLTHLSPCNSACRAMNLSGELVLRVGWIIGLACSWLSRIRIELEIGS